MHLFTKALLQWHQDNPRPLPWSDGKRDPYSIWISEIIMQQTRVEQGTPYYLRFIKKFPTLRHLARASEDEVLKMWEGLGYYSRARNLHKAAKYIVDHLDGKFPDTYDDLLKLPGIGPYSAAAIASFAYGHKHVVVDGNVKRVISRYAGVTSSIDEPSTYETIREIAFVYMSGNSPEVFNQAIMNFGALVCKPKPACVECNLSVNCYAHKHTLAESLPVRTKKKQIKTRNFHFVVIRYRDSILLQRRESSDIWKGLFSPPVIECTSSRAPSKIVMQSLISEIAGHDKIEFVNSSGTTKQMLTHQTIFGRYHQLRLLKAPKKLSDAFVWVDEKTVNDFGKPKMVGEIMKPIWKDMKS